ncbi:MAG: alpha/beta fold hydrolase [Pseudomonadota bacterium]
MNQQPKVKTYRYTILAMGFLEKILGSNITVDGLENIPPKPVLFVCNHFTRSETFVVPYIIYKYTKRQVRCLADSGLFHGVLGRFLKSVGALSTKDKKRDIAIISDLIKGRYDWMIYPEGSMVKSKEIRENGKSSYSFGSIGGEEDKDNRVRTGSAVLALKSELYRADLIDAKRKDRQTVLEYYRRELEIEFDGSFKNLQTNIVPVNITYYPIRPGKNVIQKIIARIFKTIPKQISEELEIEGNLLLSSNMNISFGQPINLTEYVKGTKNMIYQIPIISNETKANLVLKYLKYRLTNQFMADIYSNTKINIDHLLAAILYFYPQDQINISHLKALIYLSVNHITTLKKYRINGDIIEEKLFNLLVGENFSEFVSVINLAKMLDIISDSADKKSYLINKNRLNQKYDFQQIRLENTLQVILNEFLLLNGAVEVIKRNVLLTENEVKQKSFNYIFSKDLENFEKDYNLYHDDNLSQIKTVGMPLFLDNSALENKKSSGILLVHGYLAAPKEMEEMAEYFNNLGFKTYSARLDGHGTAPINLENVKWQDWYASLNRGYGALKLICDKVFVVGFSTGALLALMAAFKKANQVDGQIDGIVCINPALKLKDVRAKFTSGIYVWNDILEKFNITKGQLRYVENHSENPGINYSRNYIKGVEQLKMLMENCQAILEKITCPVLIIQSTQDPVIDRDSVKIMLEKINSKMRSFKEIDSQKHIIIKGQGSEKVFEMIEQFVTKNSN